MGSFSPSRLRARRLAAGVSREELAIAVSRTALTVSLWERGLKTPYANTIGSIARRLNCTSADLCEPARRRAAR